MLVVCYLIVCWGWFCYMAFGLGGWFGFCVCCSFVSVVGG